MDIERFIFENVKKTISDYKLLDEKEKVLVALSGGKDSISVLYILKKLGYNVSALTIDLNIGDYTKKNVKTARAFCKEHNIDYHDFSGILEWKVIVFNLSSFRGLRFLKSFFWKYF